MSRQSSLPYESENDQASRIRRFLETERSAHDLFADSRRDRYQEHSETVRRLDDHVGSRDKPIVVVGESGAGKSALLAYWSEHFRTLYPSAFVVAVHVGATTSSLDPFGVMRRIALEIRMREPFRSDDTPPETPEQLAEEFPSWLAHVQEEMLVLLIDAVDQVKSTEGMTSGLDLLPWLPKVIPPNVRLIVSLRPGECADELAGRGWDTLYVSPLGPRDRTTLLNRYMTERGVQLGAEQIRRIVNDSNFGNPLFFRTSVEELLRLAMLQQEDDYLDEVRDLHDLYGKILEQREREPGGDDLRPLLALLGSSRRGLSPAELSAIMNLEIESIDGILEKIDSYLTRRGGIVTFFHDLMREAVAGRYLADTPERIRIHEMLGEYFAGREMSARRAEEEPWQWLQAKRHDRLRGSITEITMFRALMEHAMEYDLYSYWHVLRETPATIYSESIDANRSRRAAGDAGADLFLHLGAFLQVRGELDDASKAIERAHAVLSARFGDEHPETVAALGKMVRLWIELGQYERADEPARSVLTFLTRNHGEDHPETTESRATLGILLHRKGESAAAAEELEQVVETLKRTVGNEHPRVAKGMQELAMAVRENGNTDGAEALLWKARDIDIRRLGEKHPVTLLVTTELATLLGATGRRERAIELHERTLEIRLEVLGPDHHETAQSYHNLAHLYRDIGELDRAEDLYRKALRIHESVYGPEHPFCALTLHNIGVLLRDQEKFVEAERDLLRALEILTTALGSNHRHTAVALGNLGELHLMKGDSESAAPLLFRAHEINLAVLGEQQIGTANSLNRLAGLMCLTGEHRKAIDYAFRALVIADRIVGRRSRPAAMSFYYMASAEFSLKLCTEAWTHCAEACKIFGIISEPERPYRRLAELLLEKIDSIGDPSTSA